MKSKMKNAQQIFSIRDYHDMLLIYGEARTNCTKAQRLYRDRFPRRRCPSQRTFIVTSQRLLDTGSVVVKKQSSMGPSRRTLDAEDQILDRIEENPNLSIRQLSREAGVSPYVVLRAIQEQHLHESSEEESDSEANSEADSKTDSESDNDAEESEPIADVIDKLKPIYKGQDGVYCRLCLERVDKKSITPLGESDFNYPGETAAFKKKKLEDAQEIHEMLKLCLPFFNALIFNPSVCSVCLATLKISYNFATKCQINQRLIEKYADINCTTDRVVDINKMIETKFTLSDDAKSSDTESEIPIPDVAPKNKISLTQQIRQVRSKRLRLREGSPATKKQKIYRETQDENSLTSSNATTIDPDENGSSIASKQHLTFDILRQEINTSDIKKEIPIKIESNYIDYPDFIRTELADDLHIKHKNERLVTGTDIERQHSHAAQRTESAALDKTNMPSIERESVITNINSHLDVPTSDVVK